MSLDCWVKVAQIVVYTATTIGILVSAFSYFKNNKVKRGEWLKALYEKFFESDNYKEIRREIEYDRLNSFLDIDNKGMAQNEINEEKLVDFLNFFEFISVLQIKKHVSESEVKDLFGYFITALKKNEFIRKYIQQFGFENLDKILIKYE